MEHADQEREKDYVAKIEELMQMVDHLKELRSGSEASLEEERQSFAMNIRALEAEMAGLKKQLAEKSKVLVNIKDKLWTYSNFIPQDLDYERDEMIILQQERCCVVSGKLVRWFS